MNTIGVIRLYPAEKDDVMLCKLAMHDPNLKVETAITYDESHEEKK